MSILPMTSLQCLLTVAATGNLEKSYPANLLIAASVQFIGLQGFVEIISVLLGAIP